MIYSNIQSTSLESFGTNISKLTNILRTTNVELLPVRVIFSSSGSEVYFIDPWRMARTCSYRAVENITKQFKKCSLNESGLMKALSRSKIPEYFEMGIGNRTGFSSFHLRDNTCKLRPSFSLYCSNLSPAHPGKPSPQQNEVLLSDFVLRVYFPCT